MHSGPVGVNSFSSKVEAYVKGRPAYAKDALDFVVEKLSLTSSMCVADIGAGTGLLTRELRSRFREVIAIEPNDEMRSELGESAVNGTAENTGLANASIDAIFAAQAFHWFSPSLARSEFQRVLKGSKPVVLLWNNRLTPPSSGAAELDKIMRSLRADSPRTLEADETAICQFFKMEKLNKAEFPYSEKLEKDSLISLMLSRSYAPLKSDHRYEPLLKKMETLFSDYAVEGKFTVPYSTQVYWGQV